ncbi:HTH-type transcriptional regulator SyrM 1 [Pseudomonas fluorescens]|uniref:HTH-type transcriptional regulator SyrM 1 n=1 Tax=Pseudomonas fluorescens TaxID=294 RepID=A0A5E7RCL9_PSEFL|nr:LysR family transcriptional regulator [Pseudomonas fluorescens]VVP72172.1 HTH-type transcriptional regulator SyrM 1 [Pseudomonas fluorescens]
MNLRSVDLNLLTVLDALLDEAHVSRAAERVGLSQPAASNALERCRHLFEDRLLERAPGGMLLTPKAQALRGPLKEILGSVSALVGAASADLRTLRQTVRVVMADFPAIIVAHPLHQRLAQRAPGIDLVIQPWQGGEAAQESLSRGQSDLAMSVFPSLGPDFTRRLLLHEHFVVAMRPGHPAIPGFDLQRWLSYPHVLVSGQGATWGPLDELLKEQGLSRRVGIVVPSFVMVPDLLAGSDLISLLPSRCLSMSMARTLHTVAPPIDVQGFPLHLAWHKRRDEDVAVQCVARVLEAVISELQ